MALRKIAVDLPIVFDPHKLLILLAGIDRTHSEILLPDCLQFIEMLGSKEDGIFLPPLTLHVFVEPLDERLDGFFGFDTRKVTQDNFCAGIRLLRYAYDKGMITLFDSERLCKVGQAVLKTDKIYPEFYRQPLPSGKSVTLIPDLPFSLEALIGIEEEEGVIPKGKGT
jgi:hypothetical protein